MTHFFTMRRMRARNAAHQEFFGPVTPFKKLIPAPCAMVIIVSAAVVTLTAFIGSVVVVVRTLA